MPLPPLKASARQADDQAVGRQSPSNFWNIAVGCDAGHEAIAESVRGRLHEAWNSRPEALIRTRTLAELDEDLLEEVDAVVLVIDSDTRDTPLLRPLTILEELHIPVMALIEQTPQPGSVFEHTSVLIESRNTPGAVLCARLHGMLHRQAEVNRLRREVAISRRSHGGLEEEVERIHADLQLAAQAQRGLLPGHLPELEGLRFASLWRPAHFVSGDIYDVIQLDEDHLGIFLADAVGHGVAAALMTMVICQSLKTRVKEGAAWRSMTPAEVLTRLNAQLVRRAAEPTRFATAVYAVLDSRTRRLTLAGAGHPPPLHLHRDGGVEPIETSGGVLGVFKDEQYDQVEVELSDGDRLLLYTDGFEQAFPRTDGEVPGRPLPSKRYRQEFQKLGTLSPQDMIDAIARRLDTQVGSLHQADDLTLVCVQADAAAAAAAA